MRRPTSATYRWAGRQLVRGASYTVDPSPLVLDQRLKHRKCPRLDLVSVYRRGNAKFVRNIIASLEPHLRHVALWALDDVDPTLAPHTVGTGLQPRLALLNLLERHAGSTAEEVLLLAVDDDVRISTRVLSRFIKASVVADLDLAQPAHATRSHASWDFNRRRAYTLIRWTSFVEAGPLVLFSTKGRQACFPLDESLGMGWGVEIGWSLAEQLSLGIIDAAPMVHSGKVAADYDRSASERQKDEMLRRYGLSGMRDLQVTYDVWSLTSVPTRMVKLHRFRAAR